MSAVDDLVTLFPPAGSLEVQKEFWRDTERSDQPIILFRSEGGSVANTLEDQPVMVMVVQDRDETLVVSSARNALESLKVDIMEYDFSGAPNGLYNVDIVGGILPVQMKDGRKGFSMNLIARYGRTEAIRL
tara:strand:- start:213 stop:605 length:393 start_codon:yes stop_codon:yes gene_type:complete